jgi:hypothetical protein
MNQFLKGNFEVKKKVELDGTKANSEDSVAEKLKKAVMGSIGGSMVYVERSELTWDGEEEADENQSK